MVIGPVGIKSQVFGHTYHLQVCGPIVERADLPHAKADGIAPTGNPGMWGALSRLRFTHVGHRDRPPIAAWPTMAHPQTCDQSSSLIHCAHSATGRLSVTRI